MVLLVRKRAHDIVRAMGPAARRFRKFIASLLAGLLAEMPLVTQPDPGVRAPDVAKGLDREHTDPQHRAFVALTERMEVAAIIPPPPPFVPAPEFLWPARVAHHYNKGYRRHPALYMQPASDAPVLWYEAEQAKKAAA